MPEFRELRVEDECPTIQHRFRMIGNDAPHSKRTLVVAFSGTYRLGSEGNPDATYMRGMVNLACEMWRHTGLVIDLSELSYEWGDLIDIALNSPDDGPMAIVVGENCEAALATLWFGEGTEKPATESEGVFWNLEDALDDIDARGST